MINLLPDDAKREIHAARTNVTLVKYILVLGLGVVFLCFISIAVYFVLMSTKASAEAIVAENTSKSTAYNSVKAQAQSLRSSLASAKTILDKEVAYTKVLTGIAQVMPAGVVLDTLSLSPTTLGVPITIQAYAKTTSDALALQDSFKKSPLFSSVTLVSLESSTQSKTDGYPIAISLSLIINKSVAL
ncbi:PilN domain-containing protein [Candidatus Saccharibacteria bacterium]|nr:PilN domain-containing protein [Candidatus Saccharibacteria bacterium]